MGNYSGSPTQQLNLASSGGGATATAVATGAWADLFGANPRRRAAVISVPIDEADPLLVSLTNDKNNPGGGAIIYLAPGANLVISMSGDIPWQGAVFAQGYGAASSCFYAEVEDLYYGRV